MPTVYQEKQNQIQGDLKPPALFSNLQKTILMLNYREQDLLKFKIQAVFIATAAYGTPLADELDQLRWFRDTILASHEFGQYLIDQYYEYSPNLAESIVSMTLLVQW